MSSHNKWVAPFLTPALAIGFCMSANAQAEPASPEPLMTPGEDAVPPPTIDTDKDGKPDAWDRNSDGKADAWDLTGDAKPDVFDDDGDGAPDSPPAPTPDKSSDDMDADAPEGMQ